MLSVCGTKGALYIGSVSFSRIGFHLLRFFFCVVFFFSERLVLLYSDLARRYCCKVTVLL